MEFRCACWWCYFGGCFAFGVYVLASASVSTSVVVNVVGVDCAVVVVIGLLSAIADFSMCLTDVSMIVAVGLYFLALLSLSSDVGIRVAIVVVVFGLYVLALASVIAGVVVCGGMCAVGVIVVIGLYVLALLLVIAVVGVGNGVIVCMNIRTYGSVQS